MILSSLDPAPSGAHPRGRTWPVTLTICFAVFGTIWLGQLPTGLPAPDFCSNLVFNYPLLVPMPLGASVSLAKNWLAESATPSFLDAICPGRPPSGLPAADFCTNLVLNYPVFFSMPTGAPSSADKNWRAVSEFFVSSRRNLSGPTANWTPGS